MMNRREFLRRTAGLAAVVVGSGARADGVRAETTEPTFDKLPRWRGFNLLERFTVQWEAKPYQEQDFAWMAEWGFDFVRLPLDYRFWTPQDNWDEIREDGVEAVDQAVEWGKQYGVHVCLNLHRTPGYCVNPPKEPKDLWTDEEALEASALQWGHFARRYKGRPNREVSFNLINEPARIEPEAYVKVVRRLAGAIRAEDADRLIIADGLNWARTPVPALTPLRVAQSTRGYDPMRLTHYRASWVTGADTWEEPTWPMKEGERLWDRDRLRRERIEPWEQLQSRGVGVMVGEWGAFQHTPHEVVLAWMRDCLELWKEAGWGWAMWCFRSSFGILDSGRNDVRYENFRGHKLDRAMLELIRRY
jgi:endoglucanase